MTIKKWVLGYWHGLQLKPHKCMGDWGKTTWCLAGSHPLWSITWHWAIYWRKPVGFRWKWFVYFKPVFVEKKLIRIDWKFFGLYVMKQELMVNKDDE